MKDTVKIVLTSDNHTKREPLFFLKNTYSDFDYFFHCGDSEMSPEEMKGFLCVAGNNDYYGFPMSHIVEVLDHKIYLCHGHRDFFAGQIQMLAHKAKSLGCDVACFGHTHVPYQKTIDGVLCLNPGSIWHNRDGSQPSYMELIVTKDNIDVHVRRYGS